MILSDVGRVKLNAKLDLKTPDTTRVLNKRRYCIYN